MFYNFDTTKWILCILPPVLRRPVLFALAKALMNPLKELYQNFYSYKVDVDRQLTSNAFTAYLERYLNGLFYLSDEIYIEDYVDEEKVYLSFATELAAPVYIGGGGDDESLYLSSQRPDGIIGGFVVHIPESLNKPEYISLIERWVNYYKFSGTKHIIRVYNG